MTISNVDGVLDCLNNYRLLFVVDSHWRLERKASNVNSIIKTDRIKWQSNAGHNAIMIWTVTTQETYLPGSQAQDWVQLTVVELDSFYQFGRHDSRAIRFERWTLHEIRWEWKFRIFSFNKPVTLSTTHDRVVNADTHSLRWFLKIFLVYTDHRSPILVTSLSSSRLRVETTGSGTV